MTATSVGELAETVALSLGLKVSGRSAARSLVAALAEDAWLLLVDEAEVVADSLGPLAIQVLEGNPDLQMVVSSRRPLDIPGELVWPIEPLDYSTPDGADPRTTPAVRLLLRRLADRAVTVDDADSTTAMLVEVATHVDGLPLALELVAGQASGRSLADLVELVRAPLDVPAEHFPTAPAAILAPDLRIEPGAVRTFATSGVSPVGYLRWQLRSGNRASSAGAGRGG